MDIKAIKRLVNLVDVVRQYTQLQKIGQEYHGPCPIHGGKNPNFQITPNADGGTWVCQSKCNRDGGDIITFFERMEHLSKPQAIGKLKEIVGRKNWHNEADKVAAAYAPVVDALGKNKKDTYSLEVWAPAVRQLISSKLGLDWLNDVRGINKETATRLQLGFKMKCPYKEADTDNAGWILFPRIDVDKVVAIKWRSILNKEFMQTPKMDGSALFNLDAISPLEEIHVTEGELDACILEQADFRAVSVPSAGAKLSPEMKGRLKLATEIYLCGDTDDVGAAYMGQLMRELQKDVFLLRWDNGAKDANEFFLKVCGRDIDVFRSHMVRLKAKARATPVVGYTAIQEQLRNSGDTDQSKDPNRLHFPLTAVDRMNYAPPGSIVVIYSSYEGTGKTVFATQLALHEAKRGECVVVSSLEIVGERYLALLVTQTLGRDEEAYPNGIDRTGRITQEQKNETAKRLDQTYQKSEIHEFYHMDEGRVSRPLNYYAGYDVPPVDKAEDLMLFIREVLAKTGATRFIIDTLQRFIIKKPGESQTEAESRTIKELENIAKEAGAIIIVICQANKEAQGLKELRRDELGALRGTKEFRDVASGIYLMHRKYLAKESGGGLEPQTHLYEQKQRYSGGENSGYTLLMYDRKSSTFRAGIQEESRAASAEVFAEERY